MGTKHINEFSAKVGAVVADFRTLPLTHKEDVMRRFGDLLRSDPSLCCTALQRIYDHFYLETEGEKATRFFMRQGPGERPEV